MPPPVTPLLSPLSPRDALTSPVGPSYDAESTRSDKRTSFAARVLIPVLFVARFLFLPPVCAQVPQEAIHPTKTGQELITALQDAYTPIGTLGYDVARDSLFRYLDTRDGVLVGRYGGYTVDIGPEEDPTQAAYQDGAGLSTEHTWPQSMGADSEPAKSDMHALFPVKQTINAARSNHPYAEIPDADTDTWYWMSTSQSTIPTANLDEYSELDGTDGMAGPRFEVREDHEGNAARAAFYFYTIYKEQANENFFDVQKQTLLQWHQSDGVNALEYDLGQWIKSKQGTANPFVLDTTLVRRAFGAPSDVPVVQFATASQSVGEDDGTATLTVEIADPDGHAVDVDVVFDESQSSASAEDVGRFSTETVSFLSSASDGATQAVLISLTDDTDLEGLEDAVFALQSLTTSGDAQIGGRSSTVLNIADDENPLVVNEVLADPAFGTDGDANQDGTRSARDDEFIEIYNTAPTDSFDLSNYQYFDLGVGTRHVFPAGTVVPPEESIVVFGGGAPASHIPGIVQTASEGTLGINNEGDSLEIRDPSGRVMLAFSHEGRVEDESMTRDPDFTGPFVRHSSASGSGGAPFSPGRMTDETPLPVEIVALDAQWTGSHDVRLTWRTTSETDNAGFEVQRRSDTETEWTDLTFIEGAGTTTERQSYQFTDDAIPFDADRLQYRLCQIDTDGTETLTDAVAVERGPVTQLRLHGTFPNPTTGPVTVRYAIPKDTRGTARLELFDLLGRRVKIIDAQSEASGAQEVEVDLSGLPSGTYFLRMSVGQQMRNQSVTVAR